MKKKKINTFKIIFSYLKDEKFGKIELKDTNGIIEFKDVSFKYYEDEDYILKGLN